MSNPVRSGVSAANNPVIALYAASMRQQALDLQKMLQSLEYQVVLMEDYAIPGRSVVQQCEHIFQASNRFVVLKSPDMNAGQHLSMLLGFLMDAAIAGSKKMLPVSFSSEPSGNIFLDAFGDVRLYAPDWMHEAEVKAYIAEQLQKLVNEL